MLLTQEERLDFDSVTNDLYVNISFYKLSV